MVTSSSGIIYQVDQFWTDSLIRRISWAKRLHMSGSNKLLMHCQFTGPLSKSGCREAKQPYSNIIRGLRQHYLNIRIFLSCNVSPWTVVSDRRETWHCVWLTCTQHAFYNHSFYFSVHNMPCIASRTISVFDVAWLCNYFFYSQS